MIASGSRTRDSAAVRRLRVWRWRNAESGRAITDAVVVEEPLEIRVDTHPVAVVMRTPGHDEELVAGFLLTEGVIHSAADLAALRRHPRNRHGNVLNAFLAPGVALDLATLTRHVFAASSCGLCGKATLEAVRQRFPAVRGRMKVARAALEAMPGRMRERQAAFAETGGLHGAALFTAAAELVCLREDVGRHNAVDKVIGRALLDSRAPLSGHVLLVSGRVSFEIVQKALAAGIEVVAAVGAPSSLAVDFARRSRQTLVGFLRDDRFNAYAGLRRIVS